MSKKRESHKQALRQLLDRSIGTASSDAFKAALIDEILRINDRFKNEMYEP